MFETIDVLAVRSELRRQVDLVCKVVSDVWDVPVEHHVSQLSSQGMWLTCDYPLHVGEEVVVQLTPPARNNVPAKPMFFFGRVSRVAFQRRASEKRQAGMAVQFVHDSDADAELLSRALKGLPPPLGVRRPPARLCVSVDDFN